MTTWKKNPSALIHAETHGICITIPFILRFFVATSGNVTKLLLTQHYIWTGGSVLDTKWWSCTYWMQTLKPGVMKMKWKGPSDRATYCILITWCLTVVKYTYLHFNTLAQEKILASTVPFKSLYVTVGMPLILFYRLLASRHIWKIALLMLFSIVKTNSFKIQLVYDVQIILLLVLFL